MADHLPAAEVVLLTERPAGGVAGWRAWTEPPAGWVVEGRYLTGPSTAVRYRELDTGRKVTLGLAAAWFGEGPYTVAEAGEAWSLLNATIRGRFEGGQALGSPATTGRDLWLRTASAEQEPLSADLQALVIGTAPQGRIELAQRWEGLERRVWRHDMRTAYLALCSELPCGPVEHRQGAGVVMDAYARGRFLCEWRPPADWPTVGILPVLAGGWTWPTAHEWQRGWIDAVEAHVALAAGWELRPVEALVWPKRGRPLDAWARALLTMRRSVLNARSDNVGAMVGHAVRAIGLHAIGAFASRRRMVNTVRALTEDAPSESAHPLIAGDAVVWTDHEAPVWAGMTHPEWSAAVWARCRARLLTSPQGFGALHVDPSHIVGFRTDAIYTSAAYDPKDRGSDGDYRTTGSALLPRCANQRDLIRAAWNG